MTDDDGGGGHEVERTPATLVSGLGLGTLVVPAVWLGRAVVRWGASDGEVAQSMPGDDTVPDASLVTTHAVSIAAPPAAVWPWLVQMGRGRAGWYSHDRLDNGGQPSADRIIPGLQDVAVGDVLPALPPRADGARRAGGFRVVVLDPDRALVLRAGDGRAVFLWAFQLVAEPTGTRLLVRSRWRVEAPVVGRVATTLAAPGHFVMQRRQLLGIRDRAEAGHRHAPGRTRDGQ